MSGYIRLYRQLQDHPFWKERRVFSKLEAWIDILYEVRYREDPEQVALGMSTIECKQGQSVKSLRTWSKRWNWSESKVRRYFTLLKKLEQITTENVGATTRLTVCNYATYNVPRRNNGETVTHKRRTSDDRQERKERKKEKKGGDPPPIFVSELKTCLDSIESLIRITDASTRDPNKRDKLRKLRKERRQVQELIIEEARKQLLKQQRPTGPKQERGRHNET